MILIDNESSLSSSSTEASSHDQNINPKISGTYISILLYAQSILENVCLFEDPVPSAQQDVISIIEAWKAMATQCGLKEAIPGIEGVDKYVSMLCIPLDIS